LTVAEMIISNRYVFAGGEATLGAKKGRIIIFVDI